MSATKSIMVAACSALVCSAQLFAQGITTLFCQGTETNQVQITATQFAKILSYYDQSYEAGGSAASSVVIQSGSHTLTITPTTYYSAANANLSGLTIAGPAIISLAGTGGSSVNTNALLTLDIEPGPYPPGKTAVIGSSSGNVQVTLQMSTDLVNWTTAVSGQVYTNSPTAAFFRIQLTPNANP